MRRAILSGLGGTALLGLFACGGSKVPERPPIALADTSRTATAFFLIESNPASPSALPAWKPQAGSGALQLALPSLGCTSTELVANPDGSSTLKATFACSSPADGTTLSGALWFTFSAAAPGSYLLEYKTLKLVKGTQSWTANGAKQIALNLAASRATLTTPTPMTLSFVDTAEPANSRAFSYGCNLVSDWSVAGSYRVWGTFAFQSGNDPALAGTISDQRPLAWSAGCCYPLSGSILLTQGLTSGEIAFNAPCGTYAVPGFPTFAPSTLPGCTN
jgi:hypothetical protein